MVGLFLKRTNLRSVRSPIGVGCVVVVLTRTRVIYSVGTGLAPHSIWSGKKFLGVARIVFFCF